MIVREPRADGGEWAALEALWLGQPVESPVPDALRRRVRRQSWRLALGAAGEYLTGLALCAWVMWRAVTQPTVETFVLAFAVFAFVGWATDFAVRNRRGLWRPGAETTAAWLALAEERCRRARRALKFAWLLYAAEVAFLGAWFAAHWWYRHSNAYLIVEEALLFAALLGAMTAVFWLWARWQDARLAREAAAFEALAAEVRADQGS